MRATAGPDRSFRYMRWLNVVVTENMKHCLAICDQVVRYGPAMAPPPYRFRTHNRVRGSMTQFAQSVQPKAKGLA